MQIHDKRFITIVFLWVAISHVLLLSPVPPAVKMLVGLAFVGLLPGIVLVEGLVGRTPAPPTPAEYILYAIGAGYSLLIPLMMIVNYLPGGVSRWHVLLGIDVVVGVLLISVLLQNPSIGHDEPATSRERPRHLRWVLAGALTLLLVGGFFRFTNLGYAEFQGDEARAMLRAAAVVQGYDDVLFWHRKGPAEILIPAALYPLVGQFTESTARIPFALVNLATLFAVFLLGWRMFGPIAGWTAAMLLALNGYYIAFGRIVQYESIGFLMSALLVLVCYRLIQQPRVLSRYLVLAALFFTSGFLAHYDMAMAVPPALYLLFSMCRRDSSISALGRATVVPLLVSTVILALFYVPFALNPLFGDTSDYLSDQIGVAGIPYNHLGTLFDQALLYMSSYYLLAIVGGGVVALAYAYRHGVADRWNVPVAGIVLLGTMFALLRPEWSPVAGIDVGILVFFLVIPGVWVLPRLSVEERTVWLWLGASMLVALFVVAEPGTHHMPFHTPWVLLVGQMVAVGWQQVRAHTGIRRALWIGAGTATVLTALFGVYLYQLYIYNRVEVLETWQQNRPRGYWSPYDEPRAGLEFGFPHRSGWKVLGVLYHEGRLDGFYQTNASEWLADWYMRAVKRCERDQRYLFVDLRKSVSEELQEQQDSGEYRHVGTVLVYGEPRLEVYQQDRVAQSAPWVYDVADFERRFDTELSDAFLSLDVPAVYPMTASERRYRLGEHIWLEGYHLERKTVRPGETLDLTLYWRVSADLSKRYTVFNQVISPDVAIYGQRDREPGCDGNPTSRWDRGQQIVDRYEIPIVPDAKPGVYPLITGLYQPETGERLPVYDAQGQPIGTAIEVATIEIMEPQ